MDEDKPPRLIKDIAIIKEPVDCLENLFEILRKLDAPAWKRLPSYENNVNYVREAIRINPRGCPWKRRHTTAVALTLNISGLFIE